MAAECIDSVTHLVAVLTSGHRPSRAIDRDDVDSRHRVDLLTHSLQAAHEMYLVRPADEALQVAALVHDVGVLVARPEDCSEHHALVGARAVVGLLGHRVAQLVALHLEAKRYLAATDHLFITSMDSDGQRSLRASGGPMDPAERLRFEQLPGFRDALLLAAVDELARVPGRSVPSLLSWLPIVTSVAAAATTGPDEECSSVTG